MSCRRCRIATLTVLLSGCAAASPPVPKHVREELLEARQVVVAPPPPPDQQLFDSARAALTEKRPLLALSLLRAGKAKAALSERCSELEQSAYEIGRARCEELRQQVGEATPNLSFVVARLCETFEAPAPKLVATRDQVRALEAHSDRLRGATREQRAELEKTIEAAVLASAWFHESAASVAQLRASGSHEARFSSAQVKRKVGWNEKIPYYVNEAHEQPSFRTETSTETRPVTQFHTALMICTTQSLCSRTIPVTTHESSTTTRETRMSTIKMQTVTRHREEPRTFEYDVTEHRGEYDAEWKIELGFTQGAPLATTVGGHAVRVGEEHKTTFAPAGVAPKRSQLMSHQGWFFDRLAALARELPALLREHWAHSFCDQLETHEGAARCARGALQDTPDAAMSTLSTFLGDDARLLLIRTPL